MATRTTVGSASPGSPTLSKTAQPRQQITDFRNEPLTDFTRPENRSAMEQALATVRLEDTYGSHDVILVQAGTATSTRGRGELNSFNAIHLEANRIEVRRYGWRPLDSVFQSMGGESFGRSAGGWKSLSPAP